MAIATNIMNTGTRIKVKENELVNYDVIISQGILDPKNFTIRKICGDKKVLVVLSENVSKLYFTKIKTYFEMNFSSDKYHLVTIPTGEKNKTIEQAIQVCNEGKEFQIDRRSIFLAMGGGVLMDIVGFAASMYKRKIDYVRIPTTLVGQIDAGIGIKTGVNFGESKNFLGSYHAPIVCINDLLLLETLPKKEIRCGLAEIIKMAIIKEPLLFSTLEQHHSSLIHYKFQDDKNISSEINTKAIISMIEELSGNFYESILTRSVDFGHTFSPYIEVCSNYQIEHGEAVAIDIAISTEIAYLKNLINQFDRNRILTLILNMGLDIYNENTSSATEMYKSLENIMLHRGLKLNLVVPTAIGQYCYLYHLEDLPLSLLSKALLNLKKLQMSYKEELEP
jgi:3-dehydroquinate synthase